MEDPFAVPCEGPVGPNFQFRAKIQKSWKSHYMASKEINISYNLRNPFQNLFHISNQIFFSLLQQIDFVELSTPKPCVGVCQYYRSMGLDMADNNPYQKRESKRFAQTYEV